MAPSSLALLDVAEHPVALLLGDQRALDHVGPLRVAVGHRSPSSSVEQLDALVVAAAGQQHPGGDGAALAGVGAHGEAHERRDGEVGVVEHDRWRTCRRARGRAASCVAAPFSMMRLPTAVEPVNEIRSTSGDSVSSSPTRWSDEVTTLTTPAGCRCCSAIEPAEQRGVPRRVGRGLEHDGVAGGERLAELVDRDLEREVPRHDGADDAHRLLRRSGGGRVALHVGGVGEVGLPRELVDQLGRVARARARAARRAAGRG